VARFAVGDVVCSKLGGPKMIVETIGNPFIFCYWPDGNDFRRGHFQPETLEKVDQYEARVGRQAEEWTKTNVGYDPLAEYR
jgi:uncharacterized protein YodC (DUF2158 family)